MATSARLCSSSSRRGTSGRLAIDEAVRPPEIKPGDPCCGFDVNGMEGLWPALPVEAHGIHDAIDTRDGSGNGAIVIDIGLDRVELNVVVNAKVLLNSADALQKVIDLFREA